MRRPEIILEIKNPIFFEVINKPIIYTFFKDLTKNSKNRKNTKKAVVFRLLRQHSEIWGTQMRTSSNAENKISSNMYCQEQLIYVYESSGSQFFRTIL